jgi:hypothetical protein
MTGTLCVIQSGTPSFCLQSHYLEPFEEALMKLCAIFLAAVSLSIAFSLEARGRASDVSGLYYLRGVNPVTDNDVGTLKKTPPVGNEMTFCGEFVVFHFDEPGTYAGEIKIHKIYYHLWQKMPELPMEGKIFDIGYNTNGLHTGKMVEWFTIDTDDHITCVDKYRLVQAVQVVDPNKACFNGQEIFDFEIISVGNGPRVRCHPNQYSFVILNLEDDSTLKGLDRDEDHLSDYDELFVHYTSPFDEDTDDDGSTDFEEVKAGIFGFAITDPNNHNINTPFKLPASLDADSAFLNAATGGSIRFTLKIGALNANRPYVLLGCASSTSTGYPLPGGLAVLPLSWDPFTDVVVGGLNSPVFEDFLGVMDFAGKASARLNAPPVPAAAGVKLYFAFACSNPFDTVSNPVVIEME